MHVLNCCILSPSACTSSGARCYSRDGRDPILFAVETLNFYNWRKLLFFQIVAGFLETAARASRVGPEDRVPGKEDPRSGTHPIHFCSTTTHVQTEQEMLINRSVQIERRHRLRSFQRTMFNVLDA